MTQDFVVEDQSAVEALLVDPDTHGGENPTRVDTHGAVVFLTKNRVYKMKRAVKFPYMDFSTREKRLAALEEEFQRNRQTAPGLYCGIAPITKSEEGLRLGAAGDTDPEAVEHVLIMRRFEATFDEIAERGELKPGYIVTIAEQIADFHRCAELVRRQDAAARAEDAIRGAAAQARKNPDILPVKTVDRTEACLLNLLTSSRALIRRRSAQGLERRCHGDLHLRNICLLDGEPALFDAIEFNEEFARIDVLYDLAFLLMDLEGRGFRHFANMAMNTYLDRRTAAGWPDEDGLALMPLFLGLRATIRAEVGAQMAAVQRDDAIAAATRKDAREHLDQAANMLVRNPPRVVAVGGLSGSGKSTLAGALVPLLGRSPGARWLRSDVMRKALRGLGPLERLPGDAYTTEWSDRVYKYLLKAATSVLSGGHSVVLDAVFAKPAERFAVQAMAARLGVPFHGIWLDAPLDTRTARVVGRSGDASDAGPSVAKAQSDYDLGPITWRRLDAATGTEAVLASARKVLAV